MQKLMRTSPRRPKSLSRKILLASTDQISLVILHHPISMVCLDAGE
jgi:hypothetical protein